MWHSWRFIPAANGKIKDEWLFEPIMVPPDCVSVEDFAELRYLLP